MARNPVHRATSFAHLVGLGAPAAGKPSAEDDEDEDDKKDAKASDDEDDDGEKKPDASEGDDEPDEDDDKSKSKKAKADDDEDEDEDDEKKDPQASAFARGFRAAQARAAAILSHSAAAANLPLAAELATGNSLPTKQAIALLKSASVGGAAKPGLSDRMAGIAGFRTSADGGPGRPSGKHAVVDSWDAAAAKAGIRPRS